jgi:hypothetical protein
MSNIFDFLNDMGTYEDRKIGREYVDGLTVSTAFTSDEGYETAIGDSEGFHPVERYDSKGEAISGHEKWCKEAITLKEIIELGGLGGLVGSSVVSLKRKKI